MRTLFAEFKANPMWPWLFGAILLILGLVIIAFHQYWRSPAAIIVSVVGWFLAIRGVLLLTVPQAYDAAGDAVYSSATALIWVVFVCLALSGVYLTYVGWKPQPGPS
jgi:FtsH-binding integral membrane protein